MNKWPLHTGLCLIIIHWNWEYTGYPVFRQSQISIWLQDITGISHHIPIFSDKPVTDLDESSCSSMTEMFFSSGFGHWTLAYQHIPSYPHYCKSPVNLLFSKAKFCRRRFSLKLFEASLKHSCGKIPTGRQTAAPFTGPRLNRAPNRPMSLAIIIPTYGTEKRLGRWEDTHKLVWRQLSHRFFLVTWVSWFNINRVWNIFLYRERESMCNYYHQNANFQEISGKPSSTRAHGRTPTATDAVNTFNGLAHSRRGRATQRSAAGSSGEILGQSTCTLTQ